MAQRPQRRGSLGLLAFLALALTAVFGAPPTQAAETSSHTFRIGQEDFLLDGKPLQIRCGEIHFARVPRAYWQHRLKMCKAMGLNTVCAYLFWNFHERQPGEFNWTDRADAAEFCRMAQQEGLWVILRPGPYVCAEWEMGGLPWWLLKEEGIQLRSRDPRFMDAARRYLKEVGRVLAPLQVTRGGPILMVQAENEYGFYGTDKQYMQDIRKALTESGFEVPTFACNPVQHIAEIYDDQLFYVVNFGSNPREGFKALRNVMPTGPLKCGEYYSGWFDTWGKPHHKGNNERYFADLEYMLTANASFSIYMAHGGTTFGLWAGADRPFKPDTSSYDYDAPISEAGWITKKYLETRKLMARHLSPEEDLPDPPDPIGVIEIPQIRFSSRARLFDSAANPITDSSPRNFEEYDIAKGCALYRTRLRSGPAAVLSFGAVNDAGWVYLDGKQVGVFDRRKRIFEVELPEVRSEARLEILVEAMGRINFGQEIHDRKGLTGPVSLSGTGGPSRLVDPWEVYGFPMDQELLSRLSFKQDSENSSDGPAFWQSSFEIDEVGDTFLDLRTWGKGIVWVNGRCLGRFWNIGPTQTLYLPGAWLKEGMNTITVLDLIGPEEPQISGLRKPILDQLRPSLDFSGSGRPNRKLNLTGATPAHEGMFPPGSERQTVVFSSPATGRFFCLESLSSHDNKQFAAVAELGLSDRTGKAISPRGWTVAYADSEEKTAEDGTAENAIDGQTANFWHTEWSTASPDHPHRLVIDLGKPEEISAFHYVPRSGGAGVGGRIKGFRIFVGDRLIEE